MIIRILFSALFMLIGYCSFAQTGRYLVVMQDGFCQDGLTMTWFANPKIIVIAPNGSITETALSTATSAADVLQHAAAFNVVVSDIMNQGYTVSPASANSTTNYFTALNQANYLGFPDGLCPSGSTMHAYSQAMTLIPCCAP